MAKKLPIGSLTEAAFGEALSPRLFADSVLPTQQRSQQLLKGIFGPIFSETQQYGPFFGDVDQSAPNTQATTKGQTTA